MLHANAPLSIEGRRRLVERCQTRPIAHVAAEMGISRACASKWVNRWRRHGDAGLLDRSSTPRRSPNATPARVVERIETWRRDYKWPAQRITDELADIEFLINRRTVTRHLTRLGLGRRRFIDPGGDSNRKPGKITARWPGHMVHLDVKKVGRIPDGGGWRIHGRDSDQAKATGRAKSAGAKRGYTYRHSAIDGFSRLSYTEPLSDEKGATAAAFLARAKIWFAAHGIDHIHRIVTDNGACYRSGDFARIVGNQVRHTKTKPYTPRHNGKVNRPGVSWSVLRLASGHVAILPTGVCRWGCPQRLMEHGGMPASNDWGDGRGKRPGWCRARQRRAHRIRCLLSRAAVRAPHADLRYVPRTHRVHHVIGVDPNRQTHASQGDRRRGEAPRRAFEHTGPRDVRRHYLTPPSTSGCAGGRCWASRWPRE